MESKNNKFMSVADFKKMIRSISPNERSDIISKYLKYEIIFNNDNCYILNNNLVLYELLTKKTKNKVLSTVTAFILKSWQ